jgi:DNA-binding response OmpR family regulator
MSSAVTVVFAREDLSIPGGVDGPEPLAPAAGSVQARFFALVSRTKPDLIILDLSCASAGGTETILTVRQQTDTPILVVCDPVPSLIEKYRIAGAAECLAAPVDIIGLNQTIQKILQVRGRINPSSRHSPENFAFAGMSFHPGPNVLTSDSGSAIELTAAESRLLAHLAAKSWTLCTRSELGERLYGSENNIGGRAIDVVVNRLRKKLVSVGGADSERLIKTEFRRGYLLIADVTRLPHQTEPRRRNAIAPT